MQNKVEFFDWISDPFVLRNACDKGKSVIAKHKFILCWVECIRAIWIVKSNLGDLTECLAIGKSSDRLANAVAWQILTIEKCYENEYIFVV